VPVLDLTKKLGIKTYSIDSRMQLDDLIKDVNFISQVGILIDFGIIVSQKVIDYFEMGILNSHFFNITSSGGALTQLAFRCSVVKKRPVVSLMLLVEAMDEGPLLGYSEITIEPTLTNPSLSEKTC